MNTAIAYLNGEFLPLAEVSISPFDRGFLFADGIYEVIPVYHGHPFRLAEHLQRLINSLAAIQLECGLKRGQWEALLTELVARNGGGNLAVYLQVTRGAPQIRDHSFPETDTPPTIFAMASLLKPLPEAPYRDGISAITGADIRWSACHIKSIALLANVLARQQAIAQGAADAILVRDGWLTEAVASNVFLVRNGMLLTPRKDHRILPGITRDLILELAAIHGIPVEEKDLPATLLADADEIWLSGSTKEIIPVTTLDGRPVGSGVPGPLWRRMTALYQDYKQMACPPVGV
ncbi:MAG: D-amino acid aminotransferase [Candidatus Competibacteraceae bacterium]